MVTMVLNNYSITINCHAMQNALLLNYICILFVSDINSMKNVLEWNYI